MANLTNECSGSGISLDIAQGYRWRMEMMKMMYRYLLAKELVGGLCPEETGALTYLAEAYQAISEFVDPNISGMWIEIISYVMVCTQLFSPIHHFYFCS